MINTTTIKMRSQTDHTQQFVVKITGAIFPSKKSMGIFIIPNLGLILIMAVG